MIRPHHLAPAPEVLALPPAGRQPGLTGRWFARHDAIQAFAGWLDRIAARPAAGRVVRRAAARAEMSETDTREFCGSPNA